MARARVLLQPHSPVKQSQGDFDGEIKSYLGLAAYTWSNDNDERNEIEFNEDGEQQLGKQDVDAATGYSVNAGLRGGGASVDLQFNSVDADLVDGGINNGLYENSETTLQSYAIEGGYMVIPSTLELVAGWSSQDADGYATSSLGTGLNLA